MIAYYILDPSKVAFTIPYINHSIAWYGIFFALGFFLGLALFRKLLIQYFFFHSELVPFDIRSSKKREREDSFHEWKKRWQLFKDKAALTPYPGRKWMERKASAARVDEFLKRRSFEKLYQSQVYSIEEKTAIFADQIVFYIILGTVIGARLGHILFYEPLSYFISHPFEVLKVWEGGLASHGGILGILISLYFFSKKYKSAIPQFSAALLLDLLVIPSALVSVCIRLGNFMNQEILGTPSNLPWSVMFLHPIDGSIPIPRHPVQLYEALFYFVLFFVLLFLFYKKLPAWKQGMLSGLFFFTVFAFRIVIEFFKAKEGVLLPEGSWLSMGQVLSFPLVFFGVYLLNRSLFTRLPKQAS